MEKETCPHCKARLKKGLLSPNQLLNQSKIDIINLYPENDSAAYCEKCGEDLYRQQASRLIKERKSLYLEYRSLIAALPVITTHHPFEWNYSVLGMVTGQSTTGTGVITEFTSSFTDIFGSQSNRHNSKLKKGEDMCFAQLRKQAYDMGGNAVIATDIDYSEIGAGKGMLMVCMSGTVIKLKNLEVLDQSQKEKIEKIPEIQKRLEFLEGFQVDHGHV